MKILIYSPAFYPQVGGLEAMVAILAQEFTSLGCEVKVATQIPATDADEFAFEVIRQPGFMKLLKLLKWSDIYFQANLSLKGVWPLIFIRRAFIITHQGWYSRTDGSLSWRDHLKYFLTRFATNIAASCAIANHIPARTTIIPNSYRDDVFYQIPDVNRDRELIFVGRLVSDKGVDLLLQSLAQLRDQGLTPKLTIVGDGPEKQNLYHIAKSLQLTDQVDFVGVKISHELAHILNAHQVLVVPSLWEEPFGIVALEGIACGCTVIGSVGGGLKDAIGPCGVTFPNGDVKALTNAIADLLSNPNQLIQYKQSAASHLLVHKCTEVARAYLRAFEEAI